MDVVVNEIPVGPRAPEDTPYLMDALTPFLKHLPECEFRERLCTQPECSEIHKVTCTCGLYDTLAHLETRHPRTGEPFDTKPLYRVGVSVLLTMSGDILLGKRKNNSAAGMWSTPGGRLEAGEDIMACARREFAEECNSELYGDLRLVCYRNYADRFGAGPCLMFYVQATGYTKTIENTEPDKCEGWSWHAIPHIDLARCTEPWDILRMLQL